MLFFGMAALGLLAVVLVRAMAARDIAKRLRIERELEFANSLLQTQIDSSPLGIIVVDQAGRVASFNQRFTDFFYPDPPRAPALADPHAEDSVDEIVVGSGQILERHSVRLRGPNAESLGRIWFFKNITAFRDAGRRAQEERNFVSALLDSLPGYFAVLDADSRLVRWNETLRLLNYGSDEEMARADAFAHIAEADRSVAASSVSETIAKGSADFEFRIGSAHAGVRTIWWHARRITVNEAPHVLAVGIDVTETRAAEAALRESEQRFRIIFDSVSDGILLQDVAAARFIDVNPRGCEMFGYTREEFLAIDREKIMAGAGDGVYELLCHAKDGHTFWCEISSRTVTFSGRDVLLSTLRDVTEGRQATVDIAYRDRILHALALSTAELVKTTTSFADAMPDLLRSIGEEIAVDRLIIVRRTPMMEIPGHAELVYSWQRDGVLRIDPGLFATGTDAAQIAAIEAWVAPLLQGAPVMTHARDATGFVRARLLAAQTLSLLLLPIFLEGEYWGDIAVDDTRVVRDWTSVEIAALKTVGDVVGALFARERTAGLLQKSEQQFRTVSETVLDAIVMVDGDRKIRFWNRSAERIFGYSALEADGQRIDTFLAPPALGSTSEVVARRKDGADVTIEVAFNAMTVGPEHYAVGIARDVTERRRSSALIEQMASHDSLTGLPNRRSFIEALQVAIRRGRRSGAGFAVLSLDVDRFKGVNDTFGHPVGDRFLQAVGARLQASVREIDTVARFGGDEFAAVQTDIREPADAAILARKIVQALGEPFIVGGHEIHIGTSLGIAVYGPDSPDAEALIAHADVALYLAKAEGRGTFRFYTDEMEGEARARAAFDTDLREALAAHQFVLHYEPRIDAEMRIVGLEARVRWNHPTRGLLAAAHFIPAAEQSGLIDALSTWVLGEACRQTREWLDAGIAPARVGFNVSTLQCKTPADLERGLTTIVRDSGVSPSMLELGLTESALAETLRRDRDLLLRLHRFGLHVAIDDFGQGSSSLAELRRLRIGRVKIPPGFIADLGAVSDTAPTVRAIIDVARELGITVLADGVTTGVQCDALRRWGCAYVQGPYVAEPLAPAALAPLLRKGTIDRRILG